MSVDAAAYRDGAEVSKALQNDPLLIAAKRIEAKLVAQILKEADQEVKQAVSAASAAPWPKARDAYTDVQDTGGSQWR